MGRGKKRRFYPWAHDRVCARAARFALGCVARKCLWDKGEKKLEKSRRACLHVRVCARAGDVWHGNRGGALDGLSPFQGFGEALRFHPLARVATNLRPFGTRSSNQGAVFHPLARVATDLRPFGTRSAPLVVALLRGVVQDCGGEASKVNTAGTSSPTDCGENEKKGGHRFPVVSSPSLFHHRLLAVTPSVWKATEGNACHHNTGLRPSQIPACARGSPGCLATIAHATHQKPS